MITINKANPTSGEVTSSLTNSADGGAGLHFNGSSGNIDFTPPDLGTRFSMEFIVQADTWDATAQRFLVDFGSSGRFIIGQASGDADLAVYSGSWQSFGSPVLDDLKVHHLVITIDGTAAILYDNGNQVGTATITLPTIDSAADARIGSGYDGSSTFFSGSMYRTRFWNKTLSSTEVTDVYENATVPFADQYGSQTELVTNGDFATGDLTGWSAHGEYTVSDNALVVANAATARVCASTAFSVVAGKKYRATYKVTSYTSGTISAYYGTASGSYTRLTNRTSTSTGSGFTEEFTAGLSGDFGFMGTNGSTAYLTIDDVSVVEIGCVADYDLAFANPTQSLIVQDRAGAADGTSSATGVSQVTKIEAVNTNKLNVGGTTPLVGIGLAAGVTPAASLAFSGAEVDNAKIRFQNQHSVTNDAGISTFDDALGTDLFVGSNCYIAADGGIDRWNGSDESSYMYCSRRGEFYVGTGSTGADPSARLIIDSAGKVFLGTGTASLANLNISDTGGIGGGLLINRNASGQPTSGQYLGSIGFKGVDSANSNAAADAAIVAKAMETHTGSTAGTNLEFYTKASGTGPGSAPGTARLTIDSAGLVTASNGIAVTNSNNYGVVEGNASTLDLADDAQIQVADTIAGAMLLHIYEGNDGYGGLIFVTYNGAPVVIADPSSIFSNADTDAKICVYKSATSHDVFLKNRLGGSKSFRVLITAGNIDS